ELQDAEIAVQAHPGGVIAQVGFDEFVPVRMEVHKRVRPTSVKLTDPAEFEADRRLLHARQGDGRRPPVQLEGAATAVKLLEEAAQRLADVALPGQLRADEVPIGTPRVSESLRLLQGDGDRLERKTFQPDSLQ